LAPTGSGKTLAAFLACLDGLWRQSFPLPPIPPPPPPGGRGGSPSPPPPQDGGGGAGGGGGRGPHVSPPTAPDNDIHRNLQVPLEGVAETARQMGHPLPLLEAAVRTGDTSAAERQRLIRRPPHILITTPESLHLLLTSRARETLRSVTHCIIDEIH